MDPKQTAQLDPKLKEAYDRVMGTQTNPQPGAATMPSATPTQPVMPTPIMTQPAANLPGANPTQPTFTNPITASSTQTSPPPNTQFPTTPNSASFQPNVPPPKVMPHSTETIRIGGNSPQPVATPIGVSAKSTKKGISPIIFILGAVVFLIIYSIFWVKFLNVPIPYLNQ